MIERLSTVLPEPDSPTTPSALPRSSEKVTPSTARTSPRSVRKCVRRSRTSSNTPDSMRPSAWRCMFTAGRSQCDLLDVEVGAHLVAAEVEGGDGEEQHRD